MAKDNIPFHTVSFPCTIMGSGEPWKLVDYIKGFNWLTYYGGKFSTSQKRGIFMDQALAEFPADTYRYWLMANAPENHDASFTWGLFAQTVNKDLADVFGNFVNRTLSFTKARFGASVPAGGSFGEHERTLAAGLERGVADYTRNLEQLEFRKALGDLRAMWVLANTYLERSAPWTAIKTDKDAAAATMRTSINLIAIFARLSAPVIPETAARLLEALGLPADDLAWPSEPMERALAKLAPGHAFSLPPILLFAKIDDERVASLTQRYGGEEAGA
jgi:methionyl-tRNA synthetase